METISSTIELKEHDSLEGDQLDLVKKLNIPFRDTQINTAPVYLGIKPNFEASYYIGADWLDEEEGCSIVVLPKMDNIDFIRMFMCSLQFDIASDYFSQIYDIDFNKKSIQYSGLKNQITPLLVIHYLSLLKRIVKRGLKKEYVLREENLNSKVKGRILVIRNIRANVLTKRYDRSYCQFQEYTIDNSLNRLLKKALIFAKRFAYQLREHSLYIQLNSEINAISSHFEFVSDEIEVNEVKSISSHKLFREYNEAIRIAKMILKRFSYSINKVDNSVESTPVFWIDMSRLYEVYVYSLLYQAYGDVINFQVQGYNKTAVDFIKTDQCLIMDTKYKPRYANGNSGIVDDIRQLSAYARDEKILRKLLGKKYSNDVIPYCLIIYPEQNNNQEEPDKIIKGFEGVDLIKVPVPIRSFRKFYKISVPLPEINNN